MEVHFGPTIVLGSDVRSELNPQVYASNNSGYTVWGNSSYPRFTGHQKVISSGNHVYAVWDTQTPQHNHDGIYIYLVSMERI